MKLKGLKISREAKILFALMCLAAAVLIWVNFFTNQRQGFGGLFGGNQEATLAPSTTSTPAAPEAVTTTPDAVATPDVATPADTTAPATDAAAPSVDGASMLPSVTPDVTAVTPDVAAPETTAVAPETAVAPVEATPTTEVAPTVVAAPPTAARDVQLAQLPFLVTEAPAAPVAAATEEAALEEVARPEEQRATVNPFSPIVLAPVEASVASDPAPVSANNLVDVPVPSQPVEITTVDAGLANGVNEVQQEPLVAEGPLPEAVLPAPRVASLPRPLPGGTLPVAPDILRNMSRTPASGTLEGVAETPEVIELPVAIREPVQVASSSIVPTTLPAPVATDAGAEVELEPVGSLASAAVATEEPAASNAPLFVGASPLSSYLRNNDVRFTGYAVGPVSVGIFRSERSSNPVVVTLGQALPETEFVLTNLQGKEAEFTYGQEKQLLTLDLRR
jgi:hypothetical protein